MLGVFFVHCVKLFIAFLFFLICFAVAKSVVRRAPQTLNGTKVEVSYRAFDEEFHAEDTSVNQVRPLGEPFRSSLILISGKSIAKSMSPFLNSQRLDSLVYDDASIS